ncbi:hypothetical protein DKX38_021783 [Salix brachista]|uniref:peroxidase n=1 Tax=Salix brachista TaxID=2182728 RepID=A0A5N5K170_9ROSI|nr:hypothetical protein DKX38_021783 [Salix brachista]
MMSSRKLTQLSVICWVAVLFCQSVQSQLQVGFYTNSCRRAELIVRSAVRDGINKDRGVAAGLVRMHFHDCFVRTGGISYDVQAGRRDGKVSLIAETSDLPAPTLNVDELTQSFAKKGLSQEEMVTLSGRTGGPCCDVPAERRDGRVSLAPEIFTYISGPTFNVN